VLIVDDEDDVREIIEFRLRRAGLSTIAASNGPDALELAFERRPDLVLLDVMMPGLTGWEVTRRLRADARTSDTKVILVTARGRDDDLARGFEAGADDYIRKPFSPAELSARVKANLPRP
jgi:DNA-binding response OmpR family regulator